MSGVTLSVLVHAALSGHPYNQQRLGLQALRYARKITNRVCPDFPEDRHEEVFQQAFVELFTFGVGALVGTTGQALFRRSVFNAARVVRSNYTAAGQRTRRPAKNAPVEPERVVAEDVGRIADVKTLERCTVGEGDDTSIDFDLFESRAAAEVFQQAEDRIDLERELDRASPVVAEALRLICVNGETVS
ncbi:MAG TPA: hypothetical protein VF636_03110, partial [Sphingomonas sp.]